MGLLGRDEILGAKDIVTDDVQVPEWGGIVRIRMLTGNQKDRYEGSVFDRNGNRTPQSVTGMRARLVALCIVDQHNVPIFTEKDIPELGQKSAAALSRVWAAAMKLNAISEEDVEELVAGFDDAPSEDSPSD
jgi:hypothetical protein